MREGFPYPDTAAPGIQPCIRRADVRMCRSFKLLFCSISNSSRSFEQSTIENIAREFVAWTQQADPRGSFEVWRDKRLLLASCLSFSSAQ